MENAAAMTMNGGAANGETLSGLSVSDLTGQKRFRVKSVPKDSTIGDFVQELLVKTKLVRNDSAGRQLRYRLRLDRESRHLDAGELVGDSLQEDDEISLHPHVMAG